MVRHLSKKNDEKDERIVSLTKFVIGTTNWIGIGSVHTHRDPDEAPLTEQL